MRSFIVKKGDLLAEAFNYDAICHGANCFCTMGAGIAAGVKKLFPDAYAADSQTIYGDITKLGGFTYGYEKSKDGKELFIFNIYSQFTYDASIKPLDYEALALGLRKMSYKLRSDYPELKKIGLPLIGFGLAGGKLEMIIPIMYRELHDFEVEIVVWDGEKDADSIIKTCSGIVKVLDENTALQEYIKMKKVAYKVA